MVFVDNNDYADLSSYDDDHEGGEDGDGDDDGDSRDGSSYVARILSFPGSQQCPSESEVSKSLQNHLHNCQNPSRIIFISVKMSSVKPLSNKHYPQCNNS